MFATSDTTRKPFRQWQVCVLLAALMVLPWGLAQAQDVDAVAKRLGAAVREGELSRAQAGVMLEALRKTMAKEEAGKDDVAAELKGIWTRLQAAVKNGRLSQEDADAKMAAIKREKLRDGKVDASADRDFGAKLEAAGERIRRAVESGDMSLDEGWRKWLQVKEEIVRGAVASGELRKEHVGAVLHEIAKGETRARLGAAVAAGTLTEKEAAAKWKQRYGDEKKEAAPKKGTQYKLAQAGVEIRKAVAEGKLSAEDARAKMQALRKMADKQASGDASAAEAIGKWIDAMGERIRKAVEDGSLSEEEGWAKWQAIKDGEIAPKLKAAVQAGKMTEKEARAIWGGIEKAEAGVKLRAAVEAGELTAAEARAKWTELHGKDKK